MDCGPVGCNIGCHGPWWLRESNVPSPCWVTQTRHLVFTAKRPSIVFPVLSKEEESPASNHFIGLSDNIRLLFRFFSLLLLFVPSSLKLFDDTTAWRWAHRLVGHVILGHSIVVGGCHCWWKREEDENWKNAVKLFQRLAPALVGNFEYATHKTTRYLIAQETEHQQTHCPCSWWTYHPRRLWRAPAVALRARIERGLTQDWMQSEQWPLS